MDIRMLRYITEISKTQNLTKAAENLYISQPAMSKALHKAEKELDCQLFYRDGNNLLPTDAGQIILQSASAIIEQFLIMNESLLDLKKLKLGNVNFGLPAIVSLLFFPEIFIRFRQRYPGINLKTHEFGGVELVEQVLGGKIDVALGMRPIVSKELNEIPIFHDEVALAMNANHPLSRKSRITMEDLRGVPISTFDDHTMVHVLLLDRFCSAGIEPRFDTLSSQCDIIVEMTRLSDGVCIVPRPAAQYYCGSDMAIRSFHPVFPWELCMIFKKNAYISRAVQTLISFIQNEFAQMDVPYGLRRLKAEQERRDKA